MSTDTIPYRKPESHEVAAFREAIEAKKSAENARDARHVNAQRRKGES